MTLFGDFVTAQTMSFQRMRALLAESGGGLQEGVFGAGDLKVTQRAAGANMSVDVAVGSAWIRIDSGSRNGLAHVYSDAAANLTVTASHATNPRIDQIVLQYNDTSIPTGSGNTPTLAVLAGTATSGATLNNRTGAAVLGNDRLLLADVLVPATSTSVVTANIRDRRPWARGARYVSPVTAGPAFNGVSAPLGLTARLEVSGNYPLIYQSFGFFQHNGVNGTAYTASVDALMDGVAIGGVSLTNYGISTNGWSGDAAGLTTTTPTAGSHTFDLQYGTSLASSIGLYNYGFLVYEDLRPNVANA